MIIYLDESKKIWEWKIVFWWFISKHKHKFIQKLVSKKKSSYWFSENLELKGTKDTWKQFFERMAKDIDFNFIHDNILWIYGIGYDKDSFYNYSACIMELVWRIYNKLKSYEWKVYIYADKINLGKTAEVEKLITDEINYNFPIKDKIVFQFKWSKNNNWIQIADLISYQMRIWNINDQEIDVFLSKNSVNIDLEEKFYITKKT